MTDVPNGEPSRRGRRWFVGIAVVVAGALLAAGGMAIGRMTAPGPSVVVAAGPVVEASPEAQPLPVGQPPASPSADASSRPVVLVAADSAGRPAVVMTAGDALADSPTTAIGYRIMGEGISPGQVASILAGVLGATGTPTEASGTWTVGSATGSRLVVNADPLVTWQFTDAQASARPATGPPMETDRAIDLATTLLGSIGVDTNSVDWQVDRYSGHTQVTAWQTVDGARTSLFWQVSLDPAGNLIGARGFSAGMHQVPGYPVVGARTAIQRTGQSGWNALVPRLITAADVAPSESPTPTPTASDAASSPEPSDTFGSFAYTPLPSGMAAPADGSSPSVPDPSPSVRPSLAVPVTEVTVDAAELGVAQYWQPDGSLLILPSYVVTGSDGSRWSVLAVDGSYVDFVATVPSPAAS